MGDRAEDRRRASRLKRRVPLSATWGGESCAAETDFISDGGALVLTPLRFLPGLILELRNTLSGETAPARVVSCSEVPDDLGRWRVGMGLLDQRQGFFEVPEVTPPRGPERRRSRRVLLGHPVQLVRDRDVFPGQTQVVNLHGALILASKGCDPGELLWVHELTTGRACPARVIRSSASDAAPGRGFDLALEFEGPPRDFWGPDYLDA